MMVELSPVEIEMERLARKRHFVIHRGPRSAHNNTVGYFICDENDSVVYPSYRADAPGGATATEAHEWLRPK